MLATPIGVKIKTWYEGFLMIHDDIEAILKVKYFDQMRFAQSIRAWDEWVQGFTTSGMLNFFSVCLTIY